MKVNFTNRIAGVAAAMVAALPMSAQFNIDDYAGQPFNGKPIQILVDEDFSVYFEAEDFDLGAEGVTYYSKQAHDNPDQNWNGTYRPNDDVRIADHPDFRNIGNTSGDDFLCYTIEVVDPYNSGVTGGDFYIDAWVSTGSGGTGGFQLYVDDKAVTGTVSFKQPQELGWDDYSRVRANGIHLTLGKHVLKWVQRQGMNLDKFRVKYAGEYMTTHEYELHIPGIIPAPYYDEQLFEEDGVTFLDDTPVYSFTNLGAGDKPNFRMAGPEYNLGISGAGTDDNPYRIGNTESGDWWQYTVINDGEGTYDFDIEAQLWSANEAAAITMWVNGMAITPQGGVPCYTGSWDFSSAKWVEVAKGVTFYEGTSVVRVIVEGQFNLSFLKFINDEISAGVKEVRKNETAVGGPFYTLDGIRTLKPGKGLYIQNGKKVILK